MDIHVLDNIEPWEWPANAAEIIVHALRDPTTSEHDRALAAYLAGEFVVINDELADELIKIIEDPDAPPHVRSRAAIACGPALEHTSTFEWDDPDDILISEETFDRMCKSLRELYMDATAPKEVRRRALEGAVRAPENWQRDAIRAAYALDDPEWKLTAVFGMIYVRGFKKEILESLENSDKQIRFEAVRAAGANEVKEAWPHIARVLQHGAGDKDLLLECLEAAPHVASKDDIELIAEHTHSSDDEIAETASEALAMLTMSEDADWELDEDLQWDEDADEEFEGEEDWDEEGLDEEEDEEQF